jgi:hypothetical protein
MSWFSRSPVGVLAASYFFAVVSGSMVAIGPPGAPALVPHLDISSNYSANSTDDAAGNVTTDRVQQNVRYWNATLATSEAADDGNAGPYEDWFLINPNFKNTVPFLAA